MPSALNTRGHADAGAQLVARRGDRVAGERGERRRAQALHAAADGHEERQAADAVAHRLHRSPRRVSRRTASIAAGQSRSAMSSTVNWREARRQLRARAVVEQPHVVAVLAEVLRPSSWARCRSRTRGRRCRSPARARPGPWCPSSSGSAGPRCRRRSARRAPRARERRGRLRAGHGAGGLHSAPPRRRTETLLYPSSGPEMQATFGQGRPWRPS